MSFYELNADKENYCRIFYHGKADARMHFHSAVEMLFVEKGEQEVVIGGQKRVLKAGEGCFCDAFTAHTYVYDKNVLSITVIGDKSYFERAFSLLGKKIPPRFFHFDRFDLIKTFYLQLECVKDDELCKQVCFEGCMDILLSEIAKNNPFVSREKDKQEDLICSVLFYAENHLSEDLSLGKLAQVFNYSREHLSRLLHKYLSENWQNYVNRQRVKKAALLLEQNPKSGVLDVALSCGFDSANTFYRAYKKEFGCSPRKA